MFEVSVCDKGNFNTAVIIGSAPGGKKLDELIFSAKKIAEREDKKFFVRKRNRKKRDKKK